MGHHPGYAQPAAPAPAPTPAPYSEEFVIFYIGFIYFTRAIIGRSRFEAALVYKLRILSLKNEEFPFLVHKLSAI